MRTFLSLLILSLLPLAAPGAVVAEDAPVEDTALSRRLTRHAVYEARKGETLRGLAGLLYGHKTWWPKLASTNPELRKTDPDQALAEGTVVNYLAPKLGDEYVVQPNDWLVRIALWRYGSRVAWEQLLKNNPGIRNPEVIHPGDRLELRDDGMIANLSSGITLAQPATPARAPALTAFATETVLPSSTGTLSLALGVFVGMASFAGLFWFRMRRLRPADRSSAEFHAPPERHRRLPRTRVTADFGRRHHEQTRFQDFESPIQNPDLDRRPGYHSLLKKFWKRYLN